MMARLTAVYRMRQSCPYLKLKMVEVIKKFIRVKRK